MVLFLKKKKMMKLIFQMALSETMEYDFNYYFENILGFIVSDEIKNKYINKDYPNFYQLLVFIKLGDIIIKMELNILLIVYFIQLEIVTFLIFQILKII